MAMALAIEHCPRQAPHRMSRLEATRRSDPSLEAFRRALDLACAASNPTTNQQAMLRLPLDDEYQSLLAWRTSLNEANHTRAILQLPVEFRAQFTSTDDTLAISDEQASCIVESRRYTIERGMAATATMRIKYTASSLEPAALDWTDDYDSDDYMDGAARLRDASTSIHFPLTGIEGGDIEQWPGPFSRWIEDTLREFVHESCRSRAKRATMAEVWDAAKQAERADTATPVNGDQVRLGFLRLPGNKATLREAQLAEDEGAEDNSDGEKV
jgi:hypothetical protein